MEAAAKTSTGLLVPKIRVRADLVRLAASCMAKHDIRYYLNGIYVEPRQSGGAFILAPNGIGRGGVEYAEKRGRVVMKFPGSHLVLNMGGKFGRPAVANDDNIVKIIKKREKAVDMPGGGLIAARG